MSSNRLPLLLLLFLMLNACGVVPRDGALTSAPDEEPPASRPITASVSSFDRVVNQLHSAHREWEGTPYRLGGTGINGIDCSAFTQVVYRDFFGEDLPRNTREQLGTGSGVRRESIRPGDLIFFRTGRNVLHVGIAMEEGNFLHASVSNGVMISNLAEPYWAGRYIGTRRVL
ncbi:NlpC/P60 family protein [Rhodohalobacter halophilus]|uniref:NlpC/P60 family protein n=1 Tax=Rhodohalobacter halophilus TaxID=1812810 RepID=UPI000A026438|nr:NlpC/P60 family protein [Rhodohalobacter halophilus]